MKTILELLAINQHQYEMVYIDTYMRWSESVSINEAQLQMVMANNAVNRYFNMEFKKCEAEFLELINRYPNATPTDARKLWDKCTLALFNRRCLPLIKQAITLKIETYVN